MAYKFQLGAFVASGSITAEEGLDAGDSNITNVGDIALDSISADGNDLEINMTDARGNAFVIKEGSNVYMKFRTTDSSERIEANEHLRIASGKKLQLGGGSSDQLEVDTDLKMNAAADIQLIPAGGDVKVTGNVSGSGNLSVGGTIRLDGIAAATAVVADDSFYFLDSDSLVKKESMADYASLIAGNGLAASSGVFAVGVDDSSIELNSDALRVKAQGITNAMLADDAVGADELASNAVVEASIVDNAVTLAKMAGITRGSIILGDSSGDPSLLAKGTAAQFLQSDGTDPSYVSISGDATIAAGGALTIANDAVEQAMIADDAVGADQLASNAVVNASVASNAAIAASKIDFNVDLGGNVTFGSQSDDTISTAGHLTVGGNLTVNGSVTSVNSTTINITSSFTFEGPADDHETVLSSGAPSADTTLTLPTLSAGSYFLPALATAATDASAAVTAAEFAILDGGTADSSVTIVAADQLILNDGGVMKQTSMSKFATYLADEGLTVGNNKLTLDVNGLGGDKTTAAQADIFVLADSDGGDVTKKITFSNLEDQIFGNVSGDATIAAGGALTIAADAVEGSMLNDNVISGQTDFTGTLVDTDEMIFSDAGSLKKMDMSVLKTYMADAAVAVQNVDNSGTLVVGVNYFSDHGGAESATLPASPSVGQSVKIKAGSDCSASNTCTINRAGSQLIDGAASIILESPFAAVELVYVASDIWRVF